MATFIRFMGFVVLVLLVPCSALAQEVGDPGRPTEVRNPRSRTSRLFKSGRSTGFFEMLDFINRRRPAGQALTIEQFEAANEGYVTYVCRRQGERPMRRRNGVFPLVNRTDEPILWDAFCPDGRRSRELANGLYFREPAPRRASLPAPVPQEQGAPDTAASQGEEPEQTFAAGSPEVGRVPPQRPTAPPVILPPTGQGGGTRTRSSDELHAEEGAIGEYAAHAAKMLLLFGAGMLVAYLLLMGRRQNGGQNQQSGDPRQQKRIDQLSKQLQDLQQAWSSNGEGALEPARLNEVVFDSILYQEVQAEWKRHFPALPFEEDSFKKLVLRASARAAIDDMLREARAEAATQLREAEARHNRQQADARESYEQALDRLSTPNAPASSSAERTSAPTLWPPRLGGEKGNDQKPPSLPADPGMGPDPFSEPTPDQG